MRTHCVDGSPMPVMLCEPVRPRRWRGVWLWRFKCPHCRVYHHHSAMPGHRTRHCTREDSPFERTGYVLRLDPKFRKLDDECQRATRKAERERT